MKNVIIENFVYTVLLSTAFLSASINNFFVSQNMGFGIMLIFIILAFFRWIINRCRVYDKDQFNILSICFKNNLYIKIVLHLYTICLVVLNITERRFLSTNILTYINALSAIILVYLLGKRVWNIAITSLILTWLIAIVWQFFTYGSHFYEHLEFNDLSFATGYLILYYIIVKKQWYKKDILRIIIAMAIVAIAGKRIGIAALLITLVFHLFYKLFFNNKKNGEIFLNICSIVLFAFFYIFIYIIVNGELFEYIDGTVKNAPAFLMGRNYYWKVLAEMCEFSPAFLGYGRNASATLFTTDYAYMRVGNVHSDILKIYMEGGFVLFGVWLFVFFFKFRKDITKRINRKNAYIFLICTIYTFLVYLTDNTETYLITQFFYMLTPIICALKTIIPNLYIKEDTES